MPATTHHFAGVNGRGLEAFTEGQRVLLTYAEYLRSPALWERHRALLAGGHWHSAVLDSGAFSELAARKRGKTFKVPIDSYVAFVAEHGHLFHWVANLDDIEGDVATSNANEEMLLAGTRARIVPVYHEGESDDQLVHCIERARCNGGLLAVGVQRPKGSIVPTRAVKFLRALEVKLDLLGAQDIEVHGFGLTLYAGSDLRGRWGGPRGGFSLASVDSTTWLMEGCKAFNAAATETRHDGFRATIDSYQGVRFALGNEAGLPRWRVPFNLGRAIRAGGQAATVAARLQEVAA
jgi:hypothetical protein